MISPLFSMVNKCPLAIWVDDLKVYLRLAVRSASCATAVKITSPLLAVFLSWRAWLTVGVVNGVCGYGGVANEGRC